MLIVARFVTGVAAGVPGPRRPVDHHHLVRRGPGAQPGAARLRRDGGGRVLARHGGRRAADRDRLALGVLRAGAGLGRACSSPRPRVIPREERPGRRRGGFDAAGRADRDRRDAPAGPRRRPGAPRRRPAGPPRCSPAPPCCSPCSCGSSAAPPPRWCGSGCCARRRCCGRTSARCCSSASFMAFQFVVVLYLQELRGWSSLETGLALVVLGIDAVLRPDADAAARRPLRHRAVILAGMALAAVAYALFLPVGADWPYARDAADAGAASASRSRSPTGRSRSPRPTACAEDEQGVAGGLLYTSLQFGAAAGLALATAVMQAAERRARRLPRGARRAARGRARRRGDHGERSACAAGGAAGVCLNAASAGSRST